MSALLMFDDVVSMDELVCNDQHENLCSQQQEGMIKRLKAELTEAQLACEELYDFNSTIYFTIGINSVIENVNFKASQFLGVDRKSLLGLTFDKFVSPRSYSDFVKNIKALLKDKIKQTCEIDVLSKAMGRRHVVLKSYLLKNQLIRLCLIDITDINQYKTQISELKKSFYLVNNLLQHTSDAMAALDADLNVEFVNHSFFVRFSKIFAAKINIGMSLKRIILDFPPVLKKQITTACSVAIRISKTTNILIEY